MSQGDLSEPPDPRSVTPGHDRRVREALDTIVLQSLRPISTALAALYGAFAVVHGLVLEPELRRVMVPTALAVAAFFVGFRIVLGRLRVPVSLSHPLAGAAAVAVLVHALLHLDVTGEPRQTTWLLLLVLGAGILLLDPGWFALVIGGAFLGWIAIVATAPPSPEWVHFGVGLAGAAVLSASVLILRRRTFRRLEDLHFQDRMRQLELESALARTEGARRGEAEARHALEEAVTQIKESEERFRRLSDASFEAVVVHRRGVVYDANARVAELFGYTLHDLLGRDIWTLLAPERRGEARRLLLSAERDEGAEQPWESVGLRIDGRRFPVEIANSEGSWQGDRASVTVLRDASRQRQAEAILRQAADEARASDLAKSAFLATMSHELRTPLNSVIGFANILRKNRSGHLEEQELEYLGRIVSNGEHLLRLINDVLDLSKIEARRMDLSVEPVELDTLLRQVANSFELAASRKGIALVVELPEGMEPVEADAHRLRQILINLVGNALKFTDEGSVILRADASAGGVPLALEVEDTGIGIPRDRLREIFEPFQQLDTTIARRYGGTGLGLAISGSLCRLMGFELSAESHPGEGSVFRVLLRPRGGARPTRSSDSRGRGATPTQRGAGTPR